MAVHQSSSVCYITVSHLGLLPTFLLLEGVWIFAVQDSPSPFLTPGPMWRLPVCGDTHLTEAEGRWDKAGPLRRVPLPVSWAAEEGGTGAGCQAAPQSGVSGNSWALGQLDSF